MSETTVILQWTVDGIGIYDSNTYIAALDNAIYQDGDVRIVMIFPPCISI